MSPELTLDRPVEGVCVAQPRRGFRYAADAFWLAGFALEAAPAGGAALDLGTGSGIVALLLAARGLRVLGLDDRSEWAPAWRRTLAESRVAGTVELVAGSVLRPVGGRFDLVVANPPFFPAGAGPTSPDPWKAAARTEGAAGLADFVRAAVSALADGGTAALVVPVERAAEVERLAPVTERVDVGRRRSLLRLGAGPVRPPCALGEDHPRVRGWYAALGAGSGR